MHQRFGRPMNPNGFRQPGEARHISGKWQGFERAPCRPPRPPFVPFAPPHVVGEFPAFRPNYNEYQQYNEEQPGYDPSWQRFPRPPFRGRFPNSPNHRPMFHGPGNPRGHPGGNPPRGRGGYGRGMKRALGEDMNFPNKKQKENGKQPPQSFKFYCGSCDRGYQTEEKYEEHMKTHIECGWDGCPYVAAAKLVQIHREQQHKTGLAKKIWQLESKEDIDKWIAERKKNFPTKERVAIKQQQQEDKQRRGEVLVTKQFGRFRGRGRGRGRGRWQGRYQNKNPLAAEKANQVEPKSDESNSAKSRSDPLSFGVTAEHLDSDSDTEVCHRSSTQVKDVTSEATINSLAGALGNIMSSYSADSDTEKVDSKEKSESLETYTPDKRTQGHKRKREHKKENTKKKQFNSRQKHQSLLEKLLANEIRHERNVLLQCVRYIVQQNFFQRSQMSNLDQETSATNIPSSEESSASQTKKKMTNKQDGDSTSSHLRDEDPHLSDTSDNQAMDVSEEPLVEEVSDSEIADEQLVPPVIIQDVSDQAQDLSSECRSEDVNTPDIPDQPSIQDPEAIVIEDISEEPNIQEVSSTNASDEASESASDRESTPDVDRPFVQIIVDKPVVEDAPGTPVIQDITGFPVIKDLTEKSPSPEKAPDNEKDKDDEHSEKEEKEEEEEVGSESSSVKEEPIVQDLSDAPVIQDPPDTLVIEDITGDPLIRSCDSPFPQDTSGTTPSSEEKSDREGSPSVTSKPIIQDDSEMPVIQDPSDTVIEDISNEPLVQDITDPDNTEEMPEVTATPDSAESPLVQDPDSPKVEDVTDEPIIEDLSDPDDKPQTSSAPVIEEEMDTPDMEEAPQTPIIQEITDEPPLRPDPDSSKTQTESS